MHLWGTVLCGNYFQVFNCINNFIRSIIIFIVFLEYLLDSSEEKRL